VASGVINAGFHVCLAPDSAAAPLVPDMGAVGFARVVVGDAVVAADRVPVCGTSAIDNEAGSVRVPDTGAVRFAQVVVGGAVVAADRVVHRVADARGRRVRRRADTVAVFNPAAPPAVSVPLRSGAFMFAFKLAGANGCPSAFHWSVELRRSDELSLLQTRRQILVRGENTGDQKETVHCEN